MHDIRGKRPGHLEDLLPAVGSGREERARILVLAAGRSAALMASLYWTIGKVGAVSVPLAITKVLSDLVGALGAAVGGGGGGFGAAGFFGFLALEAAACSGVGVVVVVVVLSRTARGVVRDVLGEGGE